MDLALQLLFTGIGIGAVYALVALGFVLIFRATSVVNFAQGEVSMVAAYLIVVSRVVCRFAYAVTLVSVCLLGMLFFFFKETATQQNLAWGEIDDAGGGLSDG